VEYHTGRLFPSIDTIAADAGCHRNSVVGALQRLRKHGFIAWVRRSVATGNEGEFAPQREQTSNAYYFDHRRQMARRTWQRFVQLLTAKLRRLGKVPPAVVPSAPTAPAADPHGLYEALAALGDSVANAST
jgi:DNA-binding transcriptional regulator YhcF (GntR family)